MLDTVCVYVNDGADDVQVGRRWCRRYVVGRRTEAPNVPENVDLVHLVDDMRDEDGQRLQRGQGKCDTVSRRSADYVRLQRGRA